VARFCDPRKCHFDRLFVVASALKYSGIAGHSPADLWANSIVTVAAAVAQHPASPQLVIAPDIVALRGVVMRRNGACTVNVAEQPAVPAGHDLALRRFGLLARLFRRALSPQPA
jgi:hypothetical protein